MHHGTSLQNTSSITSRMLDPPHDLRVCNALLRVNTHTHGTLFTSDRACKWFFPERSDSQPKPTYTSYNLNFRAWAASFVLKRSRLLFENPALRLAICRNLETACNKHHDEAHRSSLTSRQDLFFTTTVLYKIIYRLEQTYKRSCALLEELRAVEGCENARVPYLRLAGR